MCVSERIAAVEGIIIGRLCRFLIGFSPEGIRFDGVSPEEGSVKWVGL